MTRIYIDSDMKIHIIFALFLLSYFVTVHGTNNYPNKQDNYPIPSVKTTYVHLQEQVHPPVPPPAKTHLTKGVVVRVPVHRQEEEYSNKYQEEKEEERLVIVVPVPSTRVESNSPSVPSSEELSAKSNVAGSGLQQSSGSKDTSFYLQQQAKTFGGNNLPSQGNSYISQQAANFNAQPLSTFGSFSHQSNHAFTDHKKYIGRAQDRFVTNAGSFGGQQLETTAKSNQGSYVPHPPIQSQSNYETTNAGFGNQNQGTFIPKNNAQQFTNNFNYKDSVTGAQQSTGHFAQDNVYENQQSGIYNAQYTHYKNQKPVTFSQGGGRRLPISQQPRHFASNDGIGSFRNQPAQGITASREADLSFADKEKPIVYGNRHSTISSAKLSSTVKQATEKSTTKHSTPVRPVRKQKHKKIPVLLISIPSTEKSQPVPSKINYDAWRPMKPNNGIQSQRFSASSQAQHSAQLNYPQSYTILNQPQYAYSKVYDSVSQTSQPIYQQDSQAGISYIQTQTNNNKQDSYTFQYPDFNRDQNSQQSYTNSGQSSITNFNEQQAAEKSQSTYLQPEPKFPQVHAFQTNADNLRVGGFNEQYDKTGKQNNFGQSSNSFSQPHITQSNFGQDHLTSINERQNKHSSSQSSYLPLEPISPQPRHFVNFNNQRSTEEKSQADYRTSGARFSQLQTNEARGQGFVSNFNEQRYNGGKSEINFTSSQPVLFQQQNQKTNFGTTPVRDFNAQRSKSVQHSSFPQGQVQGEDYSQSPLVNFDESPVKSEKPQENYAQTAIGFSPQITSYKQTSAHFAQYENVPEKPKQTHQQPSSSYTETHIFEGSQGSSGKSRDAYSQSVPSGFIRVQTAYRESQREPNAMIITSQEQASQSDFSQVNTERYNEPVASVGKSQDSYQEKRKEDQNVGDNKSEISSEKKGSKDGILLVLVSTKTTKDNKKSNQEYKQANASNKEKEQYGKKEQKTKKNAPEAKQKGGGADYVFSRRASVTAFTKTNDYHTGYSIVY